LATTNGKGTTPKTKFIELAREVNNADSAVVLAWLAVFHAFVQDGWSNKRAFSQAFVKAVKGTAQDKFTPETVRVSISHIEWAEENITGGAKKCLSMNAIVKQRSGKDETPAQPTPKPKPAMAVTLTRAEANRRLAKYPKALRDDIIRDLGIK
jgi:hypothetical protein